MDQREPPADDYGILNKGIGTDEPDHVFFWGALVAIFTAAVVLNVLV